MAAPVKGKPKPKKGDANVRFKWKKQPRQVEFLRACGLSHPIEKQAPGKPAARVILFGGAAGGGKSDALIVAAIVAAYTYPGCKIGYFRREYPQLEGPGGAIMRSHELLQGKAKYNGTTRRWTFPWGSIIQFCHAKSEEDVLGYQSQQFDIILIDESTHFTRFQARYLLTRNRATIKGFTPFMALGTNPGNIGHGWHKREFIDVGPPGVPADVEVEPGQFETHLFIPSFLQDNQVLERRDPGYRATLENQPEAIRRALLDGDWGVFAGQYFKDFRAHLHTCEPFPLPESWMRFCSMDWGYAAPCSVLWHAVDPANKRIYTYREIYVTEMRPEELTLLWADLSQDDPEIQYMSASPDIWAERGLTKDTMGGESIAELMMEGDVPLIRADNRRVMGWSRVRDYLKIGPDGRPYWIIFNTCRDLIRTLPELIHDTKRVEDVDGKCEDHAPEAARYGLMSRPSPIDAEALYAGGLPGEGQKKWDFDNEEGQDDYEDEDIIEAPSFY